MSRLLAFAAAPFILLAHVWAIAAVWIDGPEQRVLGIAVLVGYAVLAGFFATRVSGFFERSIVTLGPFVLVLAWWLTLEPSNDRVWLRDVARLARAEVEGDRLVFHNVRNFRYRSETDYDERWETREYDLSKLEGVDMFFSYWGSPHIAHTIASWDFGDDGHLAISIETRKEEGEEYSAVLGFFRQFELYYVVADERDLVGLRTNHRGETVRLYRTKNDVAVARAILLDYVREINALGEQPAWYNAVTHNCTTTIRHHVQQVVPNRRFDWRVLVNGYLDELGYERGTIDTSLPFEELRERSDIGERARAIGDSAEFSTGIRMGLPGLRPQPSGMAH